MFDTALDTEVMARLMLDLGAQGALPFDDAVAMVDRGELPDAKTIAGLLLVARLRARGAIYNLRPPAADRACRGRRIGRAVPHDRRCRRNAVPARPPSRAYPLTAAIVLTVLMMLFGYSDQAPAWLHEFTAPVCASSHAIFPV